MHPHWSAPTPVLECTHPRTGVHPLAHASAPIDSVLDLKLNVKGDLNRAASFFVLLNGLHTRPEPKAAKQRKFVARQNARQCVAHAVQSPFLLQRFARTASACTLNRPETTRRCPRQCERGHSLGRSAKHCVPHALPETGPKLARPCNDVSGKQVAAADVALRAESVAAVVTVGQLIRATWFLAGRALRLNWERDYRSCCHLRFLRWLGCSEHRVSSRRASANGAAVPVDCPSSFSCDLNCLNCVMCQANCGPPARCMVGAVRICVHSIAVSGKLTVHWR